ncbi:ECF RNA polymerase sigma factor SigK [Hamadaea tsunoensis]|uniref:ECF RNA polymerase sigma factor SigK n=1 Tax=Hamadaea tsunoensis TaxID=53368 RepID=UPI000416FE61|nr:ECF RNA polymerase sigma factor SigK [Hamadaea tsunoensis]
MDGAGADAPAEELLGLVATGDQRAFARLYDQVAGRVLAVATRVLRDRAQAEEVTQEAFVEAWRTAARFDPARGSALAWILTITHRRAVDRVRAEQAGTRRERAVAAPGREYDEVAEAVVAVDERRQVRRCLDALSGVQREAITLAYWGGHTYREVAAQLNLGLPAVKSRMRDGLLRLKECLAVAR